MIVIMLYWSLATKDLFDSCRASTAIAAFCVLLSPIKYFDDEFNWNHNNKKCLFHKILYKLKNINCTKFVLVNVY